jgi:SAM-dependent methyltransferase
MSGRWRRLCGRFRGRFSVAPLAESQFEIEAWFNSDVGNYLLAEERQAVAKIPQLPGYHLMGLGASAKANLISEFSNLHCFQLSPNHKAGSSVQTISEFESLPLPCETIDVAVLHHSLEFSQSPHAVLNEVARVVTPGGHIVIFVINPFSFMGLVKWPMLTVTKKPIWRHHSLRLGRVVDWLRILDFKPVSISRGGFSTAKEFGLDDNYLKKTAYGLGLPTGMFYTIVAKKYVANYLLNKKSGWVPKPIPKLGWAKVGDHSNDGCNPK